MPRLGQGRSHTTAHSAKPDYSDVHSFVPHDALGQDGLQQNHAYQVRPVFHARARRCTWGFESSGMTSIFGFLSALRLMCWTASVNVRTGMHPMPRA